ncbi:MAG: hypothetical protein AAF871_08055 [Pseudomonadota bacterium]
MTRWLGIWASAILGALAATAFALFLRLPLPFEGFAAVAAGLLAFGITLTLVQFLPAAWIWTDAERLAHAFRKRHKISADRAESALSAITTAHGRAAALREQAAGFNAHLKDAAYDVADRLDGAAREIFYDPPSIEIHRKNLIRSDLIEEAVRAHAKLRQRRSESAQIEASRETLGRALASFQGATDAAEERVQNRILNEVTVSSETAETLLAPRREHT